MVMIVEAQSAWRWNRNCGMCGTCTRPGGSAPWGRTCARGSAGRRPRRPGRPQSRRRRAGVFILTKEWLEQTRQDRVGALEALVSAQDRHWEMTGGYAARIEDLPDFGALSDYDLPDHLQLDLSRTSGGWQARLEPEEEWLTGYRGPGAAYHCFAFAGARPRAPRSRARDPRSAVCARSGGGSASAGGEGMRETGTGGIVSPRPNGGICGQWPSWAPARIAPAKSPARSRGDLACSGSCQADCEGHGLEPGSR